MGSSMEGVSEDIQKIHQGCIYPMVRVIAGRSGGSGTIIWSAKDPLSKHEDWETYALTNYHVVSGLVKVETKFDPALGRDVKKQVTQKAQVDIFRYRYWSVKDRDYGVDADIVAWDEDMDLALLKLGTIDKVDYVSKMYPMDFGDVIAERVPGWHVGDKVAAVGAALLNPPVFTEGRISRMFEEIDNHPYILSTAPTIFGNSGGAIYRLGANGTWEMIGVPARISVTASGFGWDAITHLSWAIPIFTVYKFLDKNYFKWFFDATVSKQDEIMRKEKDKRRSEIEAVLSIQDKQSPLKGRISDLTE